MAPSTFISAARRKDQMWPEPTTQRSPNGIRHSHAESILGPSPGSTPRSPVREAILIITLCNKSMFSHQQKRPGTRNFLPSPRVLDHLQATYLYYLAMSLSAWYLTEKSQIIITSPDRLQHSSPSLPTFAPLSPFFSKAHHTTPHPSPTATKPPPGSPSLSTTK